MARMERSDATNRLYMATVNFTNGDTEEIIGRFDKSWQMRDAVYADRKERGLPDDDVARVDVKLITKKESLAAEARGARCWCDL